MTASTLFPGGLGKTRSPNDSTSLISDVEQRLFGTLPDDTRVHPGPAGTRRWAPSAPHLGSGASAAGDPVQAARDDRHSSTTMVVVTSMSPTTVPVPSMRMKCSPGGSGCSRATQPCPTESAWGPVAW
ncbi:Putative Zn-dependent hydrolase, glyoxylase [Modestobacter italicus]|uniref:Zn-dependent hydrolase, glyoxylase n=1 Tax=Modestobacter italicus (strain DSM 44449 / CECT 9708 / BC 501) TaxID=2732864 RepID=I4F090_MODI5|nr:Putative Zn-dependent hydrolase, glyoxylase [Modestobacter marinus]